MAPFLVDEGLPFAAVLPAAAVEQAFAAEGVSFGATARSVFTLALTLGAFRSQVLHVNQSCQAAVLRVAVWLLALGRRPCALDTAASCRAHAKLPALVLRRPAVQLGDELADAVPEHWRWYGHRVTLVDGTTATLADTPANQQAYPPARHQQPGLGFPIVRLLVLLALATAAWRGRTLAPYRGKETGATAWLRQLLDDVDAGAVLLADRSYGTYWLVALAQARGVDVVFRLHQRRHDDFRRGRRLGAADHVVVWERPARPQWLDAATYATMPRTLTVRELAYATATPGCRTKSLVIATTLLDADAYPRLAVAARYPERWHAELDLRALKQSLPMDHRRCQTPFLVAKESWAHFLSYNLVRKVAAPAALAQGLHPREIRFSACQQAVTATGGPWPQRAAAERVRQGVERLAVLGRARVGNRPDRYEPRAVKRRPPEYDRLLKPRAQARAALLV